MSMIISEAEVNKYIFEFMKNNNNKTLIKESPIYWRLFCIYIFKAFQLIQDYQYILGLKV